MKASVPAWSKGLLTILTAEYSSPAVRRGSFGLMASLYVLESVIFDSAFKV